MDEIALVSRFRLTQTLKVIQSATVYHFFV